MKVTSAEANKLCKQIEEQIKNLQSKESKCAVFNAASTEDPEKLKPSYDFKETQNDIDDLQQKLRKIRHAINIFNTTHDVPEHDGTTIDQALILIPQLGAKKEKLRKMASRLPRQRVDSFMRSGSIIDYEIANYDINEVEAEYQQVSEKLAKLQLALDTINTSVTMDIDF